MLLYSGITMLSVRVQHDVAQCFNNIVEMLLQNDERQKYNNIAVSMQSGTST